MKPNLFVFATSELSQDAIICWLLSWASPEHKTTNKLLHNCSIELIQYFFKKHDKAAPKVIKKVVVKRQDTYIDILCIVSDDEDEEFPILIEDKTGTKDHSGQLTRYLEEIKSRGFKEKNIIPIYFKTRDQASYSNIRKNGYEPFLRDDFLKILCSYCGENSILIDYRDYLQSISDRVKSYKSLDCSKWHRDSWIGFYIKLQEELKAGHWKEVKPNGKPTFLCFWISNTSEKCEPYLQIEQGKLCFKIRVEDKSNRKKERSKWHKALITEANNEDCSLNLQKPKKFGSGRTMTVCILDDKHEYRRKNGLNQINISETIKVLQSARILITKTIKERG